MGGSKEDKEKDCENFSFTCCITAALSGSCFSKIVPHLFPIYPNFFTAGSQSAHSRSPRHMSQSFSPSHSASSCIFRYDHSAFIDLSVFFRQEFLDLRKKNSKFLFGNRPYDLIINAEIVMDHFIPHAHQLFPGDL